MSLPQSFLDEVRARTSLQQLIGKTVRLRKAGNEWQACCPFHNEKTPSFYVNDDKAFYHCFGCSAHGDAIRWLTDHEGMEFLDAVRQLAEADLRHAIDVLVMEAEGVPQEEVLRIVQAYVPPKPPEADAPRPGAKTTLL